MPIVETPAHGLKIKIGDGGVGAGTQASRTIGTSNQQAIIYARKAGVAGNSKTCSIAVSGNNTPFSFTVTEGVLTIVSATDGSGLATTTVNELLYQLMQNTTFVDHWQATRGAGNGTGVLVAGASAALAGGTDGAEVFTELEGVHDTGGPSRVNEIIQARHHSKEAIVKRASFRDEGQLPFRLYYDSSDADHQLLETYFEDQELHNFRIEMTDEGQKILEVSAIVSQFQFVNPHDGWNVVQCSLEISDLTVI